MLIKSLDQFLDYSKGACEDYQGVVNALATVGAVYLASKTLTGVCKLMKGARLYLLSQIPLFKVNYKRRYGEWAVISGSTDGIGLAMAKELAKRGHSIIVIGRNPEKLENTKKALEQIENVGQVETIKIDLSDPSLDNYREVAKQINPRERDVGILINNAGVICDNFKRFNDHSLETMKNIVNVNVLATVFLTRLVMPAMVERGRGLVVNVSSMIGHLPAPYMCVYGPSKSFIDSFSRMLQLEYAKHPIDIINLNPGGVETKMYETMKTSNSTNGTSFTSTPEYYSAIAINALSTRYNSFTGTMGHAINLSSVKCLEAMGIPAVRIAMDKIAKIQPLPRVGYYKKDE